MTEAWSFIAGNRGTAQTLVWLVLAAWAFWKGAGPEKAMATTLVTMDLTDQLYHLATGAGLDFAHADAVHFAIDGAVCVAMVLVALRANRMYTLWMAAFQIIALTAHLARTLTDEIAPIAYVILYIAPSYFQTFLLAGGIAIHVRRTRRFGAYRAWRTSLPPLPAIERRN